MAEQTGGGPSPAVESESYDGVRTAELAARWGVPAVHAFREIGSTFDAAHALAPTAAPGTLVVADEQTAGRGRHGRRWASAPNAGVWLTLIERPADARALDVLALRCGLFAAEALDTLSLAPVGLKWPNDLYVQGKKLAGILIETRWRGASAEWVAIGFGVNVTAPDLETASGLAPHATRLAALDLLIPALRRASAAVGYLDADELARWEARDVGAGRVVSEPSVGVVQGIRATGEVNIADSEGRISAHRSGSLTFVAPLQCS